jgi:thymidylate synthase
MFVKVIATRNPNTALESALWYLKISGVVNDSRNGRVVQAPGPVITTYTYPQQRVVFSALRDANPFFHLYEALWMLAGRKDAESVSRYAKQMGAFADNGQLWGAYGWRWREFFDFDQLKTLIAMLKADPKTRRAVLTMWSPVGDLVPTTSGEGGAASAKDVPCNTHVYFSAVNGVLDMTVCNRSNDIIWGAYGANVVHMSILQEFVASAVGIPMGAYHQFSNNFHAYVDRPDVQRLIDTAGPTSAWVIKYASDDRYTCGKELAQLPLVGYSNWQLWLDECERFVDDPGRDHYAWRHTFFRRVAGPLMCAHAAYKAGDVLEAIRMAKRCDAEDWALAAAEWLTRRNKHLGVD